MRDLKRQLQDALKDAMKSKDRARRDVLRLLLSAIKQVEVDEQTELDNAAVLSVLQKEAKKMRETASELAAADRLDDAAQIQFELSVVEAFLPAQLDAADLRPIVRAAIDSISADSPKAVGEVMRIVMPQVRGRADGREVNAIVREMLS